MTEKNPNIYIHLHKKNFIEKYPIKVSDINQAYNEAKLTTDPFFKLHPEVLQTIKDNLKQTQEGVKKLNKDYQNFIYEIQDYLSNMGKQEVISGANVAQLAFTKKGNVNMTSEQITEALTNLSFLLQDLESINKIYSNLNNSKDGDLFKLARDNKMRLIKDYEKIKEIIDKNAISVTGEDIRIAASLLNAQIRGDLNELGQNIKYEAFNKTNEAVESLKSNNLKFQKVQNVGSTSSEKTSAYVKSDNVIHYIYDNEGKEIKIQIGISEKSYTGKSLQSSKTGKTVAGSVPWLSVMSHVPIEFVQYYTNAIVFQKTHRLDEEYILAKNIIPFLAGDEYQAQFLNLGGDIFYIPDIIQKHKRKLLGLTWGKPEIKNELLKVKKGEKIKDVSERRSDQIYEKFKKVKFTARWRLKTFI